MLAKPLDGFEEERKTEGPLKFDFGQLGHGDKSVTEFHDPASQAAAQSGFLVGVGPRWRQRGLRGWRDELWQRRCE